MTTMSETLARVLAPHAVPSEQLPPEHRPVLGVLDELIGVTPNCYPVLALWPPGLRTFNVLVPNMLNLPLGLVGQGATKDLIGLALYASSQAAGCSYCTAHHCAYALRRGVDRETVLGHHSPAEAAVVELAEAMATVPSELRPAQVAAAQVHLSRADVEWVASAVALGGFLNKFMDSVGVELEESCLTDVQAVLRPVGWQPGKHLAGWSPDGDPEADRQYWTRSDTSDSIPVDGLGTYLRLLRQAPGAARLERSWTRGVSGRLGEAMLLLEDEVGYAFPLLGSVEHPKVVKALTAALRDNLDPSLSRVGLEAKLLAGLVYAGVVDSPRLADELVLLVEVMGLDLDPWLVRSVRRFGALPIESAEVPMGMTLHQAATVLLARACAPSPAVISEVVVEATCPHLEPEQIVELVVWLSLLQTLHRLSGFHDARSAIDRGDRAAI